MVIGKFRRRLGRIYVSDLILQSEKEALCFYEGLCPMRVEYDYSRQLFVIDACSPYFDVLELGQTIPEYDVVMSRSESGIYTKTVRKREKKNAT